MTGKEIRCNGLFSFCSGRKVNAPYTPFMNELREEKVPEFMTGLCDDELKVIYWVFSDVKISLDEERRYVADFMAERKREFNLDYDKVFDLPPEVILVCGQNHRATARNLPNPEQLKMRREALKCQMDMLKNRYQHKQ